MKKPSFTIILSVLVLMSAVLFGINQTQVAEGAGDSNTVPTFYFASSTVFTLTTSSQRLLSTSTPTHRVAVTFQPVNCTVNNGISLNLQPDQAATANSGLYAFASTTLELKTFPNLPVTQGSVQGITSAGTCTVLVTEWRLIQ